ncbi:MAG: class I SAM-dependent methyltransferase [Myxococcota bacterium]|nr:class I SAM-dependent methyltransferase [Myxococcota bacterium]
MNCPPELEVRQDILYTHRMDTKTQAVRSLYELFPYPSGSPTIRTGFDARYLLGLGVLERPTGRPIRVLDAGCSRGLGTLACAALQPDVEFLGVDINRVALQEARQEAQRRGLTNIVFAEADLSTLEGVNIPEGGFDVIQSSGVLHHLVDPESGLRLLAGALAPHGILSLMVYSESGRRETLRIAAALGTMIDKQKPLEEQLVDARAAVQSVAACDEASAAWREAALLDDVEFVDRYLHVQEQAYAIPDLWRLIEAGGLSFLRWSDPPAWSVDARRHGTVVAEQASGLGPMETAHLVDTLGTAPKVLEAYLCHPGNSPRPEPDLEGIASTLLAVHPELSFHLSNRNLWRSTRVEALAVELRGGEQQTLAPGPLRDLAFVLKDQNEPFYGESLIGFLTDSGVPAAEARQAVCFALSLEWMYQPHPVDLG